MRLLRLASLILAFLATLAPMAHVLEAPNKLNLNGALWLSVQQNLYQGWGPLIGATTEVGALIVSLTLAFAPFVGPKARRASAGAAICYVVMLASFFVLNAPVNAAISEWTAASLPADWADYRMRWETGHAISAGASLIGFMLTLYSYSMRRKARPLPLSPPS